jgi:peptidoglycan hydrolase CwlO-like protein
MPAPRDREASNRAAAEHVARLRQELEEGRAELDRQRAAVDETNEHLENVAGWIDETERHLDAARRLRRDQG